jgi:antitoxin CptB
VSESKQSSDPELNKVEVSLDTEAQIRQMRWRCRRGILEVEMILQPFFERHAEVLVTDRKPLMDQLLLCADTDLMAWFTGGVLPDEPALADFVAEILAEQRQA